jgi:hypothetical protein
MRHLMVLLALLSLSLAVFGEAKETDNKNQRLDGRYLATLKIEVPDKEPVVVEKATVVIQERILRILLPNSKEEIAGNPRAFWDFGYKIEADLSVDDTRYHVKIMKTGSGWKSESEHP